MTQVLNRRTVLAGAASIPVASLPALALGNQSDPIFAAIEAHKEAFRVWMLALKVSAELPMNEHEELHEETARRCHAESEAACELTAIVPSTMAGVFASLDYVNKCSAGLYGQIVQSGEVCRYSHELWPDELIDDDLKDGRGKEVSMPFAFWILRNIETALRNLVVSA